MRPVAPTTATLMVMGKLYQSGLDEAAEGILVDIANGDD